MTENYTRQAALEYYEKALSLFNAGHFARAQQMIRKYRRSVDYAALEHFDNRDEAAGLATVIIITRDRGKVLLDCIDSLKNQEEMQFEIIVVDNGSKIPVKNVVSNQKLLLVECPFPFTPSEGRNIGVFHARADLLIFLDDDALAEPGFVKSAIQAFEEYPFLGIRGRILPKSPQADHSLAGLYDLGNYPLPAILDIEGNMAVPTKMYHAVQGMNPLMFGAEGLELMTRLLQIRPDGDIYYWPGMIIRHDYAAGDNLLAKRKRQALANEYFRIMYPDVLEVKKRYTSVLQWRRRDNHGSLLKTLPARICNVSRDMSLALKSEKLLQNDATHQDHNSPHPTTTGQTVGKVLSQEETQALLQRVYALEMELEKSRKTLGVKLAHLISEAKSSPLRQGVLLPIRVIRLIKESCMKSRLNGLESTNRDD